MTKVQAKILEILIKFSVGNMHQKLTEILQNFGNRKGNTLEIGNANHLCTRKLLCIIIAYNF